MKTTPNSDQCLGIAGNPGNPSIDLHFDFGRCWQSSQMDRSSVPTVHLCRQLSERASLKDRTTSYILQIQVYNANNILHPPPQYDFSAGVLFQVSAGLKLRGSRSSRNSYGLSQQDRVLINAHRPLYLPQRISALSVFPAATASELNLYPTGCYSVVVCWSLPKQANATNGCIHQLLALIAQSESNYI